MVWSSDSVTGQWTQISNRVYCFLGTLTPSVGVCGPFIKRARMRRRVRVQPHSLPAPAQGQ